MGNLRTDGRGGEPAPEGFADVRVDRQTVFGNPFPMGEGGGDEACREAVCDACDALLADPAGADVDGIAATFGVCVDARFRGRTAELDRALGGLEARLRAGESLRLMCWCAPSRCHGDGIARCLQRRLGGESAVEIVATSPAPVAAPARGGLPAPDDGARVTGATVLQPPPSPPPLRPSRTRSARATSAARRR